MKVRLPLAARTVGETDCPYPLVRLRVRDAYGGFVVTPFRIDTAADFATIPLTVARRDGIPYRETNPGVAYGIVGATEKFRDRIRVVIAGKEHEWPCDFTKEPASKGQARLPLLDVSVLGRTGFLDEYTVTIDSGYLIITRLGPVRRWWRWVLHGLWNGLGMVHDPEKPL